MRQYEREQERWYSRDDKNKKDEFILEFKILNLVGCAIVHFER